MWTVTCLCAAWCGVCRDYRATFERLAAEHPGVAFRWSDIEEDEDEAEVDVETFPTLRVSCDGVERFFSTNNVFVIISLPGGHAGCIAHLVDGACRQ